MAPSAEARAAVRAFHGSLGSADACLASLGLPYALRSPGLTAPALRALWHVLVAWGRDGVIRLATLPPAVSDWASAGRAAAVAFAEDFDRLSVFAEALDATEDEPAVRCLLLLRHTWAGVDAEGKRRSAKGRNAAAAAEAETDLRRWTRKLPRPRRATLLPQDQADAAGAAVLAITEQLAAGATVAPALVAAIVERSPMRCYRVAPPGWGPVPAAQLLAEDLEDSRALLPALAWGAQWNLAAQAAKEITRTAPAARAATLRRRLGFVRLPAPTPARSVSPRRPQEPPVSAEPGADVAVLGLDDAAGPVFPSPLEVALANEDRKRLAVGLARVAAQYGAAARDAYIDSHQRTYTERELADRLGVHPRTWLRWRREMDDLMRR